MKRLKLKKEVKETIKTFGIAVIIIIAGYLFLIGLDAYWSNQNIPREVCYEEIFCRR